MRDKGEPPAVRAGGADGTAGGAVSYPYSSRIEELTQPSEPDLLPAGVAVCPAARDALLQAARCLERGLLISAWYWTQAAQEDLDAATDGQQQGAGE